ncbi:MAG: 5-dehydro-2-deoxygluconokinase [Gammaproteobacteria bacterium]|nr:5-dehydro-2-deoxygluconokinase [Gammaproteobacteria bacterium]
MSTRTLDVICLGRAAVDLYGQQLGTRLEDVQTFAKSLGGSSANVAAGLARLGVRSAMLTRVGDEQMGRFVREALAREGVDTSHVATDPRRLTGLVLLGVAGADEFPHIFYRENCADLGLETGDFDDTWIGSARALALTGTHLSTAASAAVAVEAVRLACAAGTGVVLDIDFRPVLWGIGRAADGAARAAISTEATARLQSLLPHCELVVGTEDEIRVAGGSGDTATALAAIRILCPGTVVVKRGAAGCAIHPRDGAMLDVPGFPVEVLNTLGAGDAFLAGFLSGWLAGADWRRCATLGNACGALVVSRHACTPAMPSGIELEEYLARAGDLARPALDAPLRDLHLATTTRRPRRNLCVLAFDHRRQLEQLARESGAPLARIARFKELVAEAFAEVAGAASHPERLGVIVDERYGSGILARLTVAGHWVGRAIEVPGSWPVEFEARRHPGLDLQSWPVAQVVKCLVACHPDDPVEQRLAQEERVTELHLDCQALSRELLLEVVLRRERPVDDTTLARVLRRFYNLGVRPAWWKLEPQSDASWRAVGEVIGDFDPYCNGVLLLGLDAPEAELRAAFATAAPHAICRGFAVGRSIFGPAAREWLAGRYSDADTMRDVADRYRRLIDIWQGLRPT